MKAKGYFHLFFDWFYKILTIIDYGIYLLVFTIICKMADEVWPFHQDWYKQNTPLMDRLWYDITDLFKVPITITVLIWAIGRVYKLVSESHRYKQLAHDYKIRLEKYEPQDSGSLDNIDRHTEMTTLFRKHGINR